MSRLGCVCCRVKVHRLLLPPWTLHAPLNRRLLLVGQDLKVLLPFHGLLEFGQGLQMPVLGRELGHEAGQLLRVFYGDRVVEGGAEVLAEPERRHRPEAHLLGERSERRVRIGQFQGLGK